MSEQSWKQVETIIDEVLDLPKEKRSRYIAERCGHDKQLKGEVTQLLNAIFDSEGWLENLQDQKQSLLKEVSDDIESLGLDQDLVGQKVGSYTVKKQIGQGGMGLIYLAERSDSFEHRVALKVIRHSRTTEENVQRFTQEQRILAGLNHPGIAKMFDGGVTDKGLPYILMEYVPGVPIDEYCRKNKCTVEEILDLFKQVLDAVRYAHENLIIHRDLKPGNILVDTTGRIKILDFGISKLLQEENDPNLTQTGARLLTPRYAAPEQVRQSGITTATDLYSLGIVFYELLSGVPPFDLIDCSRYEAEQIILKQQPPAPSSKASSSILSKKLQGDLDAIALKAIRKDSTRRYRMANEFLDDLSSFKNGLPVSARKGTIQYKTVKFFQRFKTGIISAAVALMLLISLTSFYMWQITQERNQAKMEADKAEFVTAFLIDLFEANDPNSSQGDTLTARHLLATGEHKINDLNEQPALKGEVLQVLGNIYGLLSHPKKADSLKTAALQLKKKIYSTDDPELASGYFSLADTKELTGEYNEALALLDTAIAYQKDIFGLQSKEAGTSLRLAAENLKEDGRLDSAYQVITEAQSIFRTLEDTSGTDYLQVLMEMGAIASNRGNFNESEAIWHRSLQLSNHLFTPPHPKILNNINGLAGVLKELGNFSTAESLYAESINMTQQLYGKKHLNTAVTFNNLAGLYYYTEQYENADKHYKKAYLILEEILEPDHPSVVSNLYNQANLKADMGRFREAEELYHRVLESDKAQFGDTHPNVASDLAGLASLFKREGKHDLAIEYYNRSIRMREEVYNNPHHPYIIYNKQSLAEIMIDIGRSEKAEDLYNDILFSAVKTFGAQHQHVQTIAEEYVKLLTQRGIQATTDSLITAAKDN